MLCFWETKSILWEKWTIIVDFVGEKLSLLIWEKIDSDVLFFGEKLSLCPWEKRRFHSKRAFKIFSNNAFFQKLNSTFFPIKQKLVSLF